MPTLPTLLTLLTDTDRSYRLRSFRLASFPVALILVTGMLPVAGCNRGSHNADVVATVNGHAIMRKDMDRGVRCSLATPLSNSFQGRPIRCG